MSLDSSLHGTECRLQNQQWRPFWGPSVGNSHDILASILCSSKLDSQVRPEVVQGLCISKDRQPKYTERGILVSLLMLAHSEQMFHNQLFMDTIPHSTVHVSWGRLDLVTSEVFSKLSDPMIL